MKSELKSILREISQSTCNIEETGIGVHNSVDWYFSNPEKVTKLLTDLKEETERIREATNQLEKFYERWQKK